MAGITALNKIRRQQAAFGGVMGKDGRKAYVGGSYATDGTGKERGSYQGRDDKGGYSKDPGQYSRGGDGPDRSAVEKGSQYYAARNPQPKPPKEKKKLNINIPDIKDIYDYGKKYLRNRKKGIYNLVGNNPKNELQFLASLQITNPEKYNSLPQNLKDLLNNTRIGLDKIADDGSFKDAPKFSYDDFESLTQFDNGAFAKYAKEIGSPGLSVSGDMSKVGMKSVRRDEFGNPVKDMFGNTLYDYADTIPGGDGQSQNYLPLNYSEGVEPVEEKETQTVEFDPSRFGKGAEAADVRRASYVFNQGGRVPRAFGGIMDTNTGRKAYGLGSVFKSITKPFKGIAKAAGKVLKSDVGKMALLYGAGAMAGSYGLKGSLFSKGMFNPMNMKAGLFGANSLAMSKLGLGEMAAKKGLLANLGLTSGYGSFAPTIKGILAGSAILPFIPGINKVPENEDIGMTARGGRLIDPLTKEEGTPASMRENIELAKLEAAGDPDKLDALNRAYNNMLFTTKPYENYGIYAANGGRIGKAEGGLMNLGGMEKDYRAEGGFVPIGKQEKADDVPARLSVNEFVFTADAVRNAGGGDIDKGAEVMENMMKNLENGGRVSEESQGNTGAQEMFSVSERIGEVI